jgi:hypothetical protein
MSRRAAFSTSTVNLNGLFAYYRFNDNITDQVGGYNGTIISPSIYQAGKSGNSLHNPNTTNGGAYVPHNNVFSFTNGTNDLPFSISLYVKKNTTRPTDLQFFVSKLGPSAANVEYQIYWSLTQIRFLIRDNVNGGYISMDYPFSMTNGQWYHVVCTYNGNGSHTGMKLYVDKTPVGTGGLTGTYVKMVNTGSRIDIGHAQFTPTFSLNGNIDGLGFWNRELTPNEVQAIYNKQRGGGELI